MNDKAINICLVAPLPPPYGGISHWTAMVCKYAKNRNDVKIDVINTAPHWRSIHELSLYKRVIGGGLQFLRDILCLVRMLFNRRVNVVHLTSSGQLAVIRDLGVLFIAGLFNVPVVYHIHFGRIPQIANANSREWRLMTKVMLKAQTVVAIDIATRCAIKEYLPAANVELLPNCIYLTELPPVRNFAKAKRTALFIGWVIQTKGISELLEAWSQLNPPGWELKIVGPGDAYYRQALIERFQPVGLKFMGELPHSQAMELMANCDLFVLPSYTEGFPNVVLEAMALGKPIIATDVGAIPEMLEGDCGILVKPKNVNSLAAALKLLIDDDVMRADFGSRARERVADNYTADTVFNRLWTLWRQAVGIS